MVFTSRKKSLNKIILVQIAGKSVLTSGNREFVEEHVSTRRKNSLHIHVIIFVTHLALI